MSETPWTLFRGSTCPVEQSDYVEVRDTRGEHYRGAASMFRWNPKPALPNITAYRIPADDD